jgi:catechol 2,3-dioxygenase-like lactoylglutathione lyase family enzyme
VIVRFNFDELYLTFLLHIIPSRVTPMKASIAFLFLLIAAFSMPAAGQLAAPNAAGVSLGHIHLYVSDVPAQQKFWATMGGVPVANQRLEMIQFPGVFILLRRAETKGGSVGSIVNHLGFVWKDLPVAMLKWQAAGYKIEQSTDPNHGYILGPDGIRLEFSGDPSLQVPVKINHIHFYPQDVQAMKAWYAKVLGGVSGKCTRNGAADGNDCVDVPGVSLAMSQIDTKLDATAGRSLDHIGFEVKNLPEFLKRMEAEGVSITQGLTASAFVSTMRVAFIADPWGTKMEITEGIAP